MKAILYNKKARPFKLVYTDIEKPVPGDDQLLVKVSAVSINAADYRSMKMGLIPKHKIFGGDVSGRVESVGKNIKQFSPGDEVFGELAGSGFGALAEYALAPEKFLVKKPAKITFEEAAALPIAGLTALQGLRDRGNIREGQKVLIVGSSGGVGTYAIQLAKYFGAEVTAVCSTGNTEQSASLGADHVIDYSKESFAARGERWDLILAVNGNYRVSTYRRCLNAGGIYVMAGGSLTQIFSSMLFGPLMSFGSRKMRTVSAKPLQEDMTLLASLVEEGKIRPLIEKRYPLEQTPEAMQYISAGHAKGKVVINVE